MLQCSGNYLYSASAKSLTTNHVGTARHHNRDQGVTSPDQTNSSTQAYDTQGFIQATQDRLLGLRNRAA